MQELSETTKTLGQLPIEYLLIFVALAAIGLATFAIHTVYSVVRNREER